MSDNGPITPRARDPREEMNGMHVSEQIVEAFVRIESLEESRERNDRRMLAIAKGQEDIAEKIGSLAGEVAEQGQTLRIVGRNVASLLTVQNVQPQPIPSHSPMPGRIELRSEADLDKALTDRETRKLGTRVQSLTDKIVSAAITVIITTIGVVALEEVRHMHDSPINQAPVAAPRTP